MVVVIVVEPRTVENFWKSYWLICYDIWIGHCSVVKSQLLDVEYRIDFKVTGDIELVGIKAKPLITL